MQRGADDYLLKDRLARLGEAVRRSLEQRRLRAERTWAVEALRQSEERYRLVSEITSDYAYCLHVDAKGELECEWITEPFTRITGFTRAEMDARSWRTLYHRDDLSIGDQHYRFLLSNRANTMETRIVTRNEQVRWIRVYDRPIWDEAQTRVVRIYGAAQDITVQKQLEQQLLQSQKMEAIGRLAGGVAHDFNNLLTVIAGYGEILKNDPLSEPARADCLDQILKAAKRATQLTKQLLTFSRRQVLQLRTVNLNTIVADVEKLLRRLIGEDVGLQTVLDPGLGLVQVDSGQIEQVMMNLAVNARDAMPSGGKLTIETANVELNDAYALQHVTVEAGAYVLLAVSDTGVGMDKETMARIFEPFFTTKERGKGTGLGLAMVYGIIKQSGGHIWVYSEPGRGTTFKVYLPRLEQEEQTVAPPPPRSPAARGSETILVVEDDSAVRGLMDQVLAHNGYTVLATGDADEALRICAQHPGVIALLVTDVILPKKSGPQVAERALALRPEMRVLYTSGYTDNAIQHHGVIQQGAPLFEKPFTPDALVRRVREVLDEPPRLAGP